MIRAALLLPVLLLAARQDPPKPEPPKPAPEEAKRESAIAKRDTLRIEVDLDGSFEPAERHSLQFKPEGYQGELVLAQAAAHGAKVKKGETCFQAESAKLADALAAAALDVEAARTGLVRAEEELRLGEVADGLQIDKADREAREAADRLKFYTEVEMGLEIKSVDEQLKMIEDILSDQKEELEQLEKMYKSEELTNATAEIVVKRARRQIERIQRILEARRIQAERLKTHDIPAQVEVLRGQARESAHQLDVVRKASPHNRKDKEIGAQRAKAALKAAEENHAKLKKDEAALTLAAPADGTLYYGHFENGAWTGVEEAARNLKAGEKVAAGTVLATVVPDALAVATSLPEANLGDLAIGGAAKVEVPAFADLALEGKTDSVRLVGARQGENYPLRIALAKGDPRLVPGLKAKVHILLAELKNVLVVPAAAVRDEGGKKFVTVVLKDKTAPREVAAGRRSGELIEIKSGLKEGEEVLLGGAKAE